jgi:hypothetical protein
MQHKIKHQRVNQCIALIVVIFLLSSVPAVAQLYGDTDVTVNTVYGYSWEIPYNPNNVTKTAQWTDNAITDVVSGQNANFGPLGAYATIRFALVGGAQVQCCEQQSGACSPTKSVMVHPMAPTIVSVTPSMVCQVGGTVDIKVSDPYPTVGTNQYRLYASNTDPTPIATISGDTFQPSVSANTTYYVTTLNSLGGESLTRTPVSVTFSTNTAAMPGVSTVYGIVGGQVTATASGAIENVKYTWQYGTLGTAWTTPENYTTFAAPPASTSSYVSVRLDNGVCRGPVAWIPF